MVIVSRRPLHLQQKARKGRCHDFGWALSARVFVTFESVGIHEKQFLSDASAFEGKVVARRGHDSLDRTS
jgi:hypothetical protein